jgi:hypothetical protein
MPKPLIIVAALLVAALSASAGWFGVKAWRESQTVAQPSTQTSPTASASPVPQDQTLSLTFDVESIDDSVTDMTQVPACGDTYAPDPHVANNVEARVDGAVMLNNGVETLEANPGFRVAGDDALAFLASEGTIVVTRDDVVVSPDWGAEFVPEYYAAKPNDTMLTEGNVSMTGADFCDVSDVRSAIWEDIDWAIATDPEIAEVQAESDAFDAEHKDLPAGEYKLYMLSPVIVGEPAAIARALTEEGISGLATLQYTVGYSPLADEPDVQQYCESTDGSSETATERQCYVPTETLLDLLRRDVPIDYVVAGEPDQGVSEAYSVTVD